MYNYTISLVVQWKLVKNSENHVKLFYIKEAIQVN